MPRISKNPDERREEIVSCAQKLFIEKGFAETKISDIVKTVGVSQGVFYYYFASKEDIINEIVNAYIKKLVNTTASIVSNGSLNSIQRLENMSTLQLQINMLENNRIHSIKGVDIHERIMKRLILDYVPLMHNAFDGGSKVENLYMIEIFVAAANVLFDPGIFFWSKADRNNRINFLVGFLERSLGVKEGSLSFYKKLMGLIN